MFRLLHFIVQVGGKGCCPDDLNRLERGTYESLINSNSLALGLGQSKAHKLYWQRIDGEQP